MVEERKPNYNPADYAEVQREAKAMDKNALEEYYVKDRDKSYTPCGGKWAIALFIIIAIVALGYGIYSAGQDNVRSEVGSNINEIERDICSILGSDYISSNLFENRYYTNKIICNEFNSVLK